MDGLGKYQSVQGLKYQHWYMINNTTKDTIIQSTN